MRYIHSLLLALLLTGVSAFGARAQAPESIWLSADQSAFNPGDTVTLRVNAISGTQIQGFTFSIRYDTACLAPGETTSSIPGMSLLALPQTEGVLEATFASTTPQAAGGALADVRFTALAECQTTVTLENAALAVKGSEGFALPLVGTTMGQQSVQLTVGPGAPVTPVPAEGTPSRALSIPTWVMVVLALLILLIIFVVYQMVRAVPGKTPNQQDRPRD